MIKVKIERSKLLSLEVNGHAGYDDPGQDLICAAASTLAYTFAQITEDKTFKMKKTPVIEIEKGRAKIVCEPLYSLRHEIKTCLDTLIVGFKLLEFNFPEYISVDIVK